MTLPAVNSSSAAAAASSANGLAAGTSSASSSSEAQDRFLKLLVAQLNNQDPMNPMDNAQMTTQMAQISTVTGIENLNKTVSGLGQQFAAMQMLQGSALVGREVLVAGNRLDVQEGVGRASFELPAGSSSTRVEVLSPGGQLLGTVPMGPLAAGRHDFSWDASGYAGGGTLQYRVVSSDAAGTGQQQVTTYSRTRVDSIALQGGAMQAQLASGTAVGADQLAAVY